MDPEARNSPPAIAGSQWLQPRETSALTYYRPAPAGPDGDGDVGSLLAGLRRRKWTILVATLAVLITVAVFTYMTPEMYESNVTVMVQASEGGAGTYEVLERMGTTSSIQTEIQLIESRRVAEAVARDLGLNVILATESGSKDPADVFRVFEIAPDAEPGTYRVVPQDGGAFTLTDPESGAVLARLEPRSDEPLSYAGLSLGAIRPQQEDPFTLGVSTLRAGAARVQGRVTAQPMEVDTDLIMIVCRGTSAVEAQRLCAGVSDAYMDLRTELQHTEAVLAAETLKKQAAEVGQRLREAEDELGRYMAANQAVALEQRAGTEVAQLAATRAQRDQLAAERSALASLTRQLDQGQGARDLASFPSFVGNQSQVVAGLVGNIIALENQRSELAVTRTERNPDMMAIDQRIEQIEEQLRSFASSYDRALQAEIVALDRNVGGASGRLSAIPEKQVETGRLDRQVSLLDDLYRYLQSRLREAEVASMTSLPSIRLVDEASLPMGPSSPNVQMNMMVGLLLGLGFGVVMALYREHTDSSIRERKDVERETGIAVLGMIPGLKKPGPILPIAISGDGNGSVYGDRLSLAPKLKMSWEEEVVLEAFRSLAADLKFSGEDLNGGHLRSVAVTSSGRGDGKTFTACNLAVARASQGAETLIIDADLRASGVARFFDLPWTASGFTDVLSGDVEAASIYKTIEIADGLPLSVLPSGNPKVRSGGMLERFSERMERMLEQAESEFDLVIVDTPPLNVLTDAATIASRVDAVIVVVRQGVTDRAALELTLERLARANSRVIGIVLNDVDLPEYYTSYSKDFGPAGRKS
ncbi:MAG TPA: polysaccharide biosynthesis tyrosine autokinase [Gemmatimonadota bacterium]|nr:polysaccharide biosynthesis tyrosine autokinase [Gemmatimonadota bacterium]